MKKNLINPPCFKCEARSTGCHSSCEKYITYKQEKAKEKETEERCKENERIYRKGRYKKW